LAKLQAKREARFYGSLCIFCILLFVMVKHVPLVVEVCIGNIEAHGLDSQGIYRIPGNAGVVHQLQELLDRVSI